MKFPGMTHYRTGVLIPVFTLRTESSEGTGDFLDLIELARWCVASSIDVIQLLPVNDTGSDPSPYSALSAYALHPLFLRISELVEYKAALKKDQSLKNTLKSLREFESDQRLNYHPVLENKLSILQKIYSLNRTDILEDGNFSNWQKRNTWVKEYGVFRTLKHKNSNISWLQWPDFRDISTTLIEELWDDDRFSESNNFFAWIQYRLEEQFLVATEALKSMSVVLKGDIPILMNEDSVDVWAHRDIFKLDNRAGAPPDMFSGLGQNWGFPIYNWEQLEKQNFTWWRNRLFQADKYYMAYRIDHVLGFFRIWTIPSRHVSGMLGYFKPSRYLHRNDLHSIGFDDGRIKWLSEPHVSSSDIYNAFGSRAAEMFAGIFDQIEDQDLYTFKAHIRGEKDILALSVDEEYKNTLLSFYRDIALIQIEKDEFAPSWTFRDCTRLGDITDSEKNNFEELVSRKALESEQLWEQHGENLLRFMCNTAPMLTCAEDLGVIPSCVPSVLERLEILSLKIPRWARKWNESGEPYIPHVEYPELSVCAPSVHDTSTLREWWEHEADRQVFWNSLGLQGDAPLEYSSHTAKKIISALMNTSSAIAVFQIQDYFAMEDQYRVDDSRDERTNIPGTVQKNNWSYRLPMTISELLQNKSFSSELFNIISERKKRRIHK